MITRRTLMRTAATLPFIAAGAATAQAFRFEQQAESVEGLYAAARSCGQQNAYHARLLADVDRIIDGRALPEAERQELVAGVRCPLCGCPVTDT